MSSVLTWLLCGAYLLGMCLLAAVPKPAKAHDQYKEWATESGMSCCSERKEHDGHVTGDCRPVRAVQDMDGNWIAYEGKREYHIPPQAIRPIKSPDGRSHLCEMNEYIFCFVPGEVRS